jgi:hypothetical protein
MVTANWSKVEYAEEEYGKKSVLFVHLIERIVTDKHLNRT